MPAKRQNIQPDALARRVVNGHVLYSHVVTNEGTRTIYVSGQLARDRAGNVVGKGDMRAQLRGAALPTSTTVEVRRLAHPDFLVEVEAIAVV